jgi:hypothetical protein
VVTRARAKRAGWAGWVVRPEVPVGEIARYPRTGVALMAALPSFT